jgi:hypothetical protein
MREHSEHDSGQPGPGALAAFRAAVGDLLLDIAGQAGPDDAAKAEAILIERTGEPEITAVLANTPSGATDVVNRLLVEMRQFRPSPYGGVADLGALVRVVLLSQIDLVWWGHLPPYRTGRHLRAAGDLVDLEALRRRRPVAFRYRRPSGNPLTRAGQKVNRWFWPDHAPPCPAARCARARPEMVALLDQVSGQLADRVGGTAPPLWVNGLARSEHRQRRLYQQGYPEVVPSAHCVGYAADVDMAWPRRFEAHGTLAALLMERLRAGEANVIDEGPSWHVCVSPLARTTLWRDYADRLAS